MKLSALKDKLSTLNAVNFVQPNGTFVPQHFHITELGLVSKHFIDCGGTVRKEQVAVLQIWVAEDIEHRLTPTGFSKIINLSDIVLGDIDLDIEIEYQTDTIGTYKLDIEGENFVLLPKHTDCLAKNNCGISEAKKNETTTCCSANGGCC